ncbi:MAG TPA: HAD family phosphatase [Tenuifilaceae bacterium]|nr:HAD family phosphatase [Tenuifilaceae bacterium]HPE19634.1 HAD family phosphatase [Tenuifilaceae bacterium]HPJ47199.1 HAD family phosphatase [Tenuifilaceae bacterium]HPQ35835.1 HAD family phosphatase [Tenuifilaceae bacterium]HRX69373.1 HAD family phosphatase [Tenuifilaceae bacterium]
MSKPFFIPFRHRPIKNIIFDLGGVILNIDYHLTINAFKKLGIDSFESYFSQAQQNGLFDKLDKGQISPQEFRNSLRELVNLSLSDSAINQAWNAMLLDFPKHRIELLKKVKGHYKTFLLSNTNAIHIEEYNKILDRTFGYKNLSFLFNKEYYSHEIGMRKPDEEVFLHIIKENLLHPEETLFIDDSIQHVEAAQKLGINTYHLNIPEGESIENLFQ